MAPLEAAVRWRWALLASLPAVLLLAWQVALVWPFFSDDAFISLRYSERLLAGQGLTWTDGERVEGYSNLLWVLACAGLGALGLDLVVAARWLGGLATWFGFLALAGALRPTDLRTACFAALAPLLAASSQVLLAWTTSGLEGPLVFALLAWGFGSLAANLPESPAAAARARSALWRASVPFALLCWTRPDAPLWVAGTALALVLPGHGAKTPWWPRIQRGLTFAALPLLAFTLQLGFRLAYHGDVVPNTAHVKADFDPGRWTAGLTYVLDGLFAHQGVVGAVAAALAIAMVLAAARGRAWQVLVLLGLPVLLWLAYLVAIGGDHFPGRRLWHGAIAPLVLLATRVVQPLWRQPGSRWFLVVALLVPGAIGVVRARHDGQTAELRAELWEWRGKVVGEALAAEFAARAPRLAVDAAGAVPFYSRLPALDLLGLCDRTIATTPLPAWLATMRPEIPRPAGHLRGNGRYVMDRAPDLLLFSNPPGLPLPVFASACEFEDDPRFLAEYRAVLVDFGTRTILPGHAEALVMPLWVARFGRAGVQTTAAGYHIPAWLFGAHQMTGPIQRRHQPPTGDAAVEAAVQQRLQALLAWFGPRPAVAMVAPGGWQLELRSAAPAPLRLPLAAGSYRIELVPPDAALDFVVVAGASLAAGRLAVGTTGEVDLALQPRADASLPVRLQAVQLRRD
jgi:arabinofuranosyltransferase